jgi:hypothetical protein
MTELAFGILCVAATLGLGLAYLYVRDSAATSRLRMVAAFHGFAGSVSLAVLLAGSERVSHQNAMGTGGFRSASETLLALALALGLVIAWAARRRWRRGAVVAAHAGFAIAGFVMLLALITLG